jgi:uncharacterized protein (TIRG00374 family)
MKKLVQIVVGCLVSAAMLYVAFKDVELQAIKDSFARAAWWPVFPFLGFFVLHYFFRSLRWRCLLPQAKGAQPSLRMLFDSMMLGNLATFLLPFRLGEFIRPLVLTRWSEYSFASSFISVVIERFFDLSAVLISFVVIVQLLPDLPEWLHVAAYSLGGVSVALLLFLVGGCLFPQAISTLVSLCVRPLPSRLGGWISRFAGDLVGGAMVIRTPSRLCAILLLTAAVWLTAYLQFYSLLFMFPFNTSFLLSVALGVFVALAIALPSAPGFVGVFQVGCVAAFNLFSYPISDAQVFSIIVHAITYALFISIGFWLIAIHNLNLLELKRAAENREAASQA